MSVSVMSLANGVEGVFIENTRFSTTRISFNFYMPLEKENVAARGLLPFLLTTCSEKYPDFSRLNYKLNKLYGASLEASTEKIGDLQLLKITACVIDDKYALDNEPLCEQTCELLLRLIFEPKILDGSFCDEDVEREKRKAIEHIKGEIADKRLFARKRLVEEMYDNDIYGISKCGSEQEVAAHHAEVEEKRSDNDGQQCTDGNNLHRKVFLRANGLFLGSSAFENFAHESESALDDAPALDHTDDTGHGDASDTNALCIAEYLFGRSRCRYYSSCHFYFREE